MLLVTVQLLYLMCILKHKSKSTNCERKLFHLPFAFLFLSTSCDEGPIASCVPENSKALQFSFLYTL